MGILDNLRDVLKHYPWRSGWARDAWQFVIGPLAFLTAMFGVMFLGSAIVDGKDASTGALITVVLVAITAGATAYFGVPALAKNRLSPATYERVGLVASWAFILIIVGVFLALAFR